MKLHFITIENTLSLADLGIGGSRFFRFYMQNFRNVGSSEVGATTGYPGSATACIPDNSVFCGVQFQKGAFNATVILFHLKRAITTFIFLNKLFAKIPI